MPEPVAVLRLPAVPELPEVETVRLSLAPHLVGHRVVKVEARRISLREGIEPASWRARFTGTRILRSSGAGSTCWPTPRERWRSSTWACRGGWCCAALASPANAHTHLVLRMDHGLEVRFVDPRRFGVAVGSGRRGAG